MAENTLAPEEKLPKAPPVLPDDEVLYELADLFRVFGDSTRIKILYALHDDELCVQDIANAVQLSQSAVSHQLRVLKDSKLVRFRRDGKTIYYALDDDHVRSILSMGMDHIEEFRQTDETFELQLLRQFALQQDKETSERVIAEHLDRLEKTQSRLEEQLHALEQRKAQELAAEVSAFDPVVPEDPDIPQENPAEDVPEPEGEPLDPDLWPEASAPVAA